MKADFLGIYVHIPFCVRKCAYCDFCSFPPDRFSDREKYIDALCNEILEYKARNITIDTVFFGGGTPSLLTPLEFGKIFDAIEHSFRISPGAEITMEANPKTLTRENAAFYKSRGVNRFSLGLQSIHQNELKLLGRIHLYSDFVELYNLLRDIGVKNINVDLMYGIPNQTQASFADTLATVAALKPEHISLYSLILEEGTPLYSMREHLDFPNEECDTDMYFSAVNTLSALGYKHYEISNYAMPGKESRHNLKYWRDEEYIGVGLSAYSYFDGERYGNTSNVESYLSGASERKISSEQIDISSEAYEYVMLALRLADGFSLDEYKSRFGEDFAESRLDTIKHLIDNGYAQIRDGNFSLTDRGMYVSNAILTELI